MNARLPHPPASNSGGAVSQLPGDVIPASAWPARLDDRACCCPARAMVRVVMPPTAARSHATELLMCGHHYRVSRQALAAAGARVRELPGTPAGTAA